MTCISLAPPALQRSRRALAELESGAAWDSVCLLRRAIGGDPAAWRWEQAGNRRHCAGTRCRGWAVAGGSALGDLLGVALLVLLGHVQVLLRAQTRRASSAAGGGRDGLRRRGGACCARCGRGSHALTAAAQAAPWLQRTGTATPKCRGNAIFGMRPRVPRHLETRGI